MNMNVDSNVGPQLGSLSNSTALENKKVKPSDSSGLAIINPSDVLCGRGKLSFNHAGNKRFRDLVADAVDDYNAASSRQQKAVVVNAIVDEIQASGGRFLRRNEATETWHSLNQTQCREKVGHAIRDANSIIENRKKRRQQRAEAQQTVTNAIHAKATLLPSLGMDLKKSTGMAAATTKKEQGTIQSSSRRLMGNESSLRAANAFNKQYAAHGQLFAEKNQFSEGGTGLFPSNVSSMGMSMRRCSLEGEMEKMTATDVWRSNLSSSREAFQQESTKITIPRFQPHVEDETDNEFLAFIDHMLGPLSPDSAAAAAGVANLKND